MAQLLAHSCVERAEGLVEKQHLRVDGKSAGEAHALSLAAGELSRVALAEPCQLDEIEQLGHALLHLGPRPSADLQPERHVLPTRSCA